LPQVQEQAALASVKSAPLEKEEPVLESHGNVEIDQPPEVVFDYVADMRNEPKWLPGASYVRLLNGDVVDGGATFEGTYARAGAVRCTISRYDRPTQVTIRGEARGMTFEDAITLTAVGDGTRLDAVMRTQPKGLFKLVAPMMGRVIDKQFQSNWEKLKAILESPDANGT
jgi:carbon monoxide dehydrogenase subunit G